MPYATIDNQQIYYGEHRDDLRHERTPLVLLHGAGGQYAHWPPGLRRLPGYDVFAIDLPGHGRSQGPGRASIEDYAAFALAWAQVVGLPSFVLVGHSMGGAIALSVARHYPQRLKGLVLIATAPRLNVNPAILNQVRSNPEAVADLLVEWVHGERADLNQKRHYRRQLLAMDTETWYGDWLACDHFDMTEDLSDIGTPTLILAGAHDRMMPPREARFIAERIVGAELVVIEGAGHMVMLEQANVVTATVMRFLDRQQN